MPAIAAESAEVPEELAVAPVDRTPQIGAEGINRADLAGSHEALQRTPPAAPDLARQMWVLNSQIQITKITFEGARLSKHRIQLDAKRLGIDDPPPKVPPGRRRRSSQGD